MVKLDLSPSAVTFIKAQCREVELQKRCDRNRKRSKRRGIYCPSHGCYMHSVSQKHTLFADRAEQLQQRGVGRRNAILSVAHHTTIALEGEWLEAFWCDECQETRWYHVHKSGNTYKLIVPPPELWQQATGVIPAHGNPSVGEFTRTQARMSGYQGIKEFRFIY